MSKKDKTGEENIAEGKAEFKGLTLEQLRHEQALILVKKEFLKERALNDLEKFKKRLPFNGNSPLGNISAKGVMGKLAKGLNYMDYFMIGLSVFNAGRKVMSFFRKK